jgi:N12 class adenine-specific DNA methylase
MLSDISDFNYRLIKVCGRAGKEYYHLFPEVSLVFPLSNLNELDVKISRPNFSVIAFSDCDVTVFSSGRMLIEEIPENSEARAREIVDKILSAWCK